MHISVTIITLITATGLALSGCTGKNPASAGNAAADPVRTDTLPPIVNELLRTVEANDSAGFAAIVSYPLARPYPLKDIPDAESMKAYYPVLMDDSIRTVLTSSSPADWEEYGWRGWAVADGQYVWVNESVYDIPYVSRSELATLRRLIISEMESLHPSLRDGWTPVGCLTDSGVGTVYRIDADSSAKSGNPAAIYRLAVYSRGSDLHQLPFRVMEGHKESEGSAGETIYRFACRHPETQDSDVYEIEAYSQETGNPRLHHHGHVRDLNRAYWRDLVGKKR